MRREWMGSGGPRGLQILLSGAKTTRGGFDSHTFPPRFVSRLAWGGVLVLSLLLAPPVEGAERPSVRREASPFWASARSLAFPAWGQLHNGSEKKAVVLFALQTYLLGRVFTVDRRAGFYRERMNDAPPAWDAADLERRYEDLRDTRRDLVWWSSLLALYSVIDAYVDAHMVGFTDDVREVERATAGLVPLEGGAALAVRVEF